MVLLSHQLVHVCDWVKFIIYFIKHDVLSNLPDNYRVFIQKYTAKIVRGERLLVDLVLNIFQIHSQHLALSEKDVYHVAQRVEHTLERKVALT